MNFPFTEDTFDDVIFQIEKLLKNKTYTGEVKSVLTEGTLRNPAGKVVGVTITILFNQGAVSGN